jgi:hypothetical protein
MDLVAQRVLRTLFLQSRDNQHISAASLAAVAGVTPTAAASALCALELAGLADASRARLTMRGLVAALADDGALGGTGPQARSKSPQPRHRPKLDVQCPWAAGDTRSRDTRSRDTMSQGACA